MRTAEALHFIFVRNTGLLLACLSKPAVLTGQDLTTPVETCFPASYVKRESWP